MCLAAENWEQIRGHLSGCLPEEACGLVGGRVGQSELVLPVTNVLHSPVRFRMDPSEQLQALMRLDECGLDLLAIYHSHPGGPNHPSETDVAEFSYPGVITLICTFTDQVWKVQAFQIMNSFANAVPLYLQADNLSA